MKEKNKKLVVALAGNPNCGKSTIFNALTGANQHIGNYPGVTVEKKEGFKSYRGYDISFVDLPGTYSLSAYSQDEVVVRDFLIKENPDIVLNVLDASNLERNLYLFTEIAELNVPMAIILNMVDVLNSQGRKADTEKLSSLLGVPVIPTVGTKKSGVQFVLDAVIDSYESGAFANKQIAKVDYGSDIKTETDIIEKLIADNKELGDYSKSWLSIKLLSDDQLAVKTIFKTKDGDKIIEQVKKSVHHIWEHTNNKAEIEIAARRYGFAKSVIKTVISEDSARKRDFTEFIDKFVLNRYLGLPIFAAVMYLIFKFTFTLSEPVVGIFERFFEWLGGFAGGLIPEGMMQSLVVDGIIGGVGGVLGFFPLVLFMFFAIAFFEDSGYMARAAFIMDKIMSKFGLHGKSFLPLMISTNGCAVPGILATRTLDSKRDRLITMFCAPFMICGAKFPIFALIISAFFVAKYKTPVMFAMYILSVIIALIAAKVLSKTVFKDDASHFVIELPPYHMPTLRGLLLKMWERGWLYIRKAGTIIVLVSIIIWGGFTFPQTKENADFSDEENAMAQIENSYAGQLGNILDPVFRPIGMDGRKSIALVAGFAAKEAVVSTLGTLYSLGEVDPEESEPLREKIANSPDWSQLQGIVFLIFCLIYPPCIVAIAVFFKETGSSIKWLLLITAGNVILAYIASFIVFQVGTLLKIGIG